MRDRCCLCGRASRVSEVFYAVVVMVVVVVMPGVPERCVRMLETLL